MKMNILIAGIVVIVIVSGIILFRQGEGGMDTQDRLISDGSADQIKAKSASNVSVVDGKQIVEISVKGGYQPKKSMAKAGIPTILRFTTNSTFDCSSSITLPSLKVSKILPNTGSTDIEIGTQQASTLQGTCSMGMYSFSVVFE